MSNNEEQIPAFAEYIFKPERSPKLLYGTFVLRDKDQKQICALVATSGAVGNQNWTDFHRIGKGLIPPYDKFQIRTDGYRLPTKGVEGMFYPIEPSPVPIYGRSELGLHFDANVPGSAGCIVIKNKNSFLETIVPLMLKAKNAKILRIPLKVTFS
jgi:hypothetical protein